MNTEKPIEKVDGGVSKADQMNYTEECNEIERRICNAYSFLLGERDMCKYRKDSFADFAGSDKTYAKQTCCAHV